MEELLKDQLGHLDLTGRVIKTEKHAHGGGGFVLETEFIKWLYEFNLLSPIKYSQSWSCGDAD
jgi:hypothetical protein